ncbi:MULTISPECIES: hypothetical protein [unclassified Streptomyces]|uniref:hypothetical protein n=1 Tax=unclassified Streptomyces TaxID=2593676 RepID=UPI001F0382B8|nr:MULTISPECIES: hypothetical protein [unclassified Streptomyces]MCH0567069.1 hypothetical protein [Streptomyces sp. MUM 2J]MCH0573191.1 hypothetical protein [Streptomyces sp. MUM 136J]
MTTLRSGRRLRRRQRNALIAAALTALSLSTGGCVVVHGERAVLPATTPGEAAKALEQFTTAYNRADRAYDTSLDADHTTGTLADIDTARLTAGHANHPAGNPRHTPLKLTDVRFTIPRKAGWPRWFVADTRSNKSSSARWLLVFLRRDLDEPWQVSYLTPVPRGAVPQFARDADGFAETVPADSPELAVRPQELSRAYVDYLQSGNGSFADGAHTSVWRAQRERNASKPGLATQYIDEPLTEGDHAPLALRTADGGALVFFSTHHYRKQTAAAGTTVPAPNQDVLALTKGEIKQSFTMEFVSGEVALDPGKASGGGSGDAVIVLGRVQGMTAAQGG